MQNINNGHIRLYSSAPCCLFVGKLETIHEELIHTSITFAEQRKRQFARVLVYLPPTPTRKKREKAKEVFANKQELRSVEHSRHMVCEL